jgi:hypothetical protein
MNDSLVFLRRRSERVLFIAVAIPAHSGIMAVDE